MFVDSIGNYMKKLGGTIRVQEFPKDWLEGFVYIVCFSDVQGKPLPISPLLGSSPNKDWLLERFNYLADTFEAKDFIGNFTVRLNENLSLKVYRTYGYHHCPLSELDFEDLDAPIKPNLLSRLRKRQSELTCEISSLQEKLESLFRLKEDISKALDIGVVK